MMRHRHILAVHQSGVRRSTDILDNRDRQTLRYAGTLVDTLVVARQECHAFDDLANVFRNNQLDMRRSRRPRLLLRNGDAVVDRCRIVCGSRCRSGPSAADNLAARRIVLRIRRENEHQIERKPYRVPLDLNIAFLHHVEQADLNFAR